MLRLRLVAVAVGNSGTILTSSDGTDWTTRTSGTTDNLLGVDYGISTFVAVGASGNIVRSTDNGSSFDNATSPTGNTMYGVAFSE